LNLTSFFVFHPGGQAVFLAIEKNEKSQVKQSDQENDISVNANFNS